jgi:hypothetical protein
MEILCSILNVAMALLYELGHRGLIPESGVSFLMLCTEMLCGALSLLPSYSFRDFPHVIKQPDPESDHSV